MTKRNGVCCFQSYLAILRFGCTQKHKNIYIDDNVTRVNQNHWPSFNFCIWLTLDAYYTCVNKFVPRNVTSLNPDLRIDVFRIKSCIIDRNPVQMILYRWFKYIDLSGTFSSKHLRSISPHGIKSCHIRTRMNLCTGTSRLTFSREAS